MQGDVATLPDIILESLVLPLNLLCNEPNESLSTDEEPEEEQFYKVDSVCHTCGARLRVCVVASTFAIHTLHSLLLQELHLLCPKCAKQICHHGRAS